MQKWAKQKGFTIVELLIVIVVIGILAAITIVAYNGIQERGRVARANSDLRTLKQAIVSARINQSKQLIGVTGNGCTACGTQVNYEATLDALGAAAGMNLSPLKSGDPWGFKYYIDENEGEAGSCANKDYLGVSPARSGVPVADIPFYSC